MLSVAFSVNGFLPVTLTLACILWYHRLTWHIIILSLVPLGLSAGSLALVTRYWNTNGNTFTYKPYQKASYEAIRTVSSICGSSDPSASGLDTTVNVPLIRLIYVYCLSWTAWCVFCHFSQRSDTSFEDDAWIKRLTKPMAEYIGNGRLHWYLKAFRSLILSVLWLLSFVYLFYLYSIFPRNELIPHGWNYGQIIAIVIWLPVVIELIYLSISEYCCLNHSQCYTEVNLDGVEDGSNYRFPPGLQVVKTIVRPSTGLANLELQSNG